MLNRRDFLKAAAVTTVVGFVGPAELLSAGAASSFKGSGQTALGKWQADVVSSPEILRPGGPLTVDVALRINAMLKSAMADAKSLLMLVTAERLMDPSGRLRLPSDERMSTLLTPSGLPIEGGSPDAVSRHTGQNYRNPVDELVSLPWEELRETDAVTSAHFHLAATLPADMPPGIYRLRLDFGFLRNKRMSSLNPDEGFARRARDQKNSSLLYSPPVGCNGRDFQGRMVNADRIVRRNYWVLLDRYNSNGYRGVISEEDKAYFALSNRNIIQDEVILPLFNNAGKKIAYNLEPAFITDTIDAERNIPWNYASGELSVKITEPSGRVIDLGTAPFKNQSAQGPTTEDKRFTSWTPAGYGRYAVTAKGWIADRWGGRYNGGGTYHFWIARRMTMATATFQGMAYPVGTAYGRDISFAPAVPADVTVEAALYQWSDPAKAKTLKYGGRASAAGIFGIPQGLKPFALDRPGEYHAKITATYIDMHGHLWVCAMRHAGVVYPEDTQLRAHGKKIKAGNQLAERGGTLKEGYVEPNDGFRNLDHINFPYNQGDVLLIASEGHGANKIEPVLTYAFKNDPQPYNPRLQAIGATNAAIKTSNGMSPHIYPEYITDWEYYYASAPRPGFPSRFLVGEQGVRAPYWPTSATNFGGQIGASGNGDLPGDIYRLVGGVVVRRRGLQPSYAGYMSSAFILPAGTKNNRVISAGSEDLTGADGRKARFFLVAARPGMIYEQNAVFVPFVQIDPILPANIRYVLRYPDGTEKAAKGPGDRFGYFIGSERWPLSQPGVYVFRVSADWQGHKGQVPGLPKEGGYLFVKEASAQNQFGLRLALGDQQAFDVEAGLEIQGFSSAKEVFYTVIMPGAIIDQGRIKVRKGSFTYLLDPAGINRRIPIYDIENRRNGRKEIGRVIHITFFSLEEPAGSKPFHSSTKVIVRGNTAIYTL